MTRTALLSVFNKTENFYNFANSLVACNFNLLASGGTFTKLQERGIPVRNVADIVGPAIFDHRVVTLSREVYASILARLDDEKDLAELERLGLLSIDLVYVDMYPLAQAISDTSKTAEQVNEMVDIGGPTMIRAANKALRFSLASEHQFGLALGALDLREEAQVRAKKRLRAQSESIVADYVNVSTLFYQNDADGTFERWRKTFAA